MAELSPLERSLVDLGEAVDWPVTPNVAPAVRVRVSQRRQRPAWRWALAAAAALLIALAGVLAISPTARETVAGWIGTRGVRIERVNETPRPAPSPLPSGGIGQRLSLGDPVNLDQVSNPALRRVPAGLGAPDEVYQRNIGPVTAVSLVYRTRADLPADPNTGAGALVVEIQAGLTDFSFAKTLPPGTRIEQVRVRGTTGFWISGEPHELIVLAGGTTDEVRLAGNVLIWTENGTTYRIESKLTRDQALAVADSLR